MPTTPDGSGLTVISRKGCHLCVDAESIARRVGRDLGLSVAVLDVDEDPALRDYTDLVPVVLIEGEAHQHWRVDESRLRAALQPPTKRWWRRSTR